MQINHTLARVQFPNPASSMMSLDSQLVNGYLDCHMKAAPLTYSKDTISIALVHEALAAAQQHTVDTAAILETAGIPQELLDSNKARVSILQFGQLWIALADAMNDEFFGMDSHALRRGSYQLLSKWVYQADHLQLALQDMLVFLNLVLDDFVGELRIENDYAILIIHDKDQVKPMFSYATYLMLIHSLMCWLTGQRIAILNMQLKCNAPVDDTDYRIRFCDQIEYTCTDNKIYFEAQHLALKIKQDEKSWKRFLKQTPYNLLVRYKNPHALSHQIRKQLVKFPPSQWLELSELTQHFNMSEATFQRRLKQEGTSYQQLKNEVRRDTAIELLSKTQQSLQEISDQLNFHDPSAFHRAFKKWTGLNPGAYRQYTENT